VSRGIAAPYGDRVGAQRQHHARDREEPDAGDDSQRAGTGRALLLLARYGKEDQPLTLPKLSQETLAEIVGTTRSRVNFFMNKFRELGFIEYNGKIKVNSSLLTVVLHD